LFRKRARIELIPKVNIYIEYEFPQSYSLPGSRENKLGFQQGFIAENIKKKIKAEVMLYTVIFRSVSDCCSRMVVRKANILIAYNMNGGLERE
jgi:hypothetical protein